MAERIAELGIERQSDYMYYIKNGDVWRVPRRQSPLANRLAERIAAVGLCQEPGYLYFLDRHGDISRAPRRVGRRPRAATTAEVAPSPDS